MTNELFKKLEKYEKVFDTAINGRYIRALDSRFAANFFEACKELNIYVKPGCPACMLNAATTLGKLYFKHKAEHQSAEEPEAIETNVSDTSVLPEVIEEPEIIETIIPDSSVQPEKQEKPKRQNKPKDTKNKSSKK